MCGGTAAHAAPGGGPPLTPARPSQPLCPSAYPCHPCTQLARSRSCNPGKTQNWPEGFHTSRARLAPVGSFDREGHTQVGAGRWKGAKLDQRPQLVPKPPCRSAGVVQKDRCRSSSSPLVSLNCKSTPLAQSAVFSLLKSGRLRESACCLQLARLPRRVRRRCAGTVFEVAIYFMWQATPHDIACRSVQELCLTQAA